MIGLALAAIASGQAGSAQPPRPPVIVAASPAQAVDPARLDAAKQLLDRIHVERQYDAMFAQLIPVMSVQVFNGLRDNEKVSAELRAELAKPERLAEAQRIFAEETAAGFKRAYPEMKSATAHEYAAAFTADELRQLIAFYDSALGQKTLDVLPSLQAKLVPIGMATGMRVGEAAGKRTIERMQIEPKKQTL